MDRGVWWATDCELQSNMIEQLLLLLLSHFSRVRLCVIPQTAAHLSSSRYKKAALPTLLCKATPQVISLLVC